MDHSFLGWFCHNRLGHPSLVLPQSPIKGLKQPQNSPPPFPPLLSSPPQVLVLVPNSAAARALLLSSCYLLFLPTHNQWGVVTPLVGAARSIGRGPSPKRFPLDNNFGKTIFFVILHLSPCKWCKSPVVQNLKNLLVRPLYFKNYLQIGPKLSKVSFRLL
jgi:hypothetical protein